MDDLLEKADEKTQNLLNKLAQSDEYVPTDYLDAAKLAIDYRNIHTEATALALIVIAEELRKLTKVISNRGVIDVEIVGSVTTYNGGNL